MHPPEINDGPNKNKKPYELWGYYEFTGSMSANSLKSGLRGPNNIRFADG